MNEKQKTKPFAPTLRYDSAEIGTTYTELGSIEIANVAQRHRIPLYEDPGVVESLARLDMSSTIPLELYGVIAEVLGFIYRLDEKQ